MVRRRERFPYEWCVAISGAVALAISPWGPSIPLLGPLCSLVTVGC